MIAGIIHSPAKLTCSTCTPTPHRQGQHLLLQLTLTTIHCIDTTAYGAVLERDRAWVLLHHGSRS